VVRVKGAAQALRRQGYDLYRDDGFVVEKNQGGAMVANTIRSVRQGIKIIEVTASRGKVTRAEPITALYAQGRISHVGTWTQLEDQMCVWGQATPQGLSSPLPEVRRINEAAATGGKANVADFAMLGLRAEAAKRAKGEATPGMKYTPPAGGNPYAKGGDPVAASAPLDTAMTQAGSSQLLAPTPADDESQRLLG